MPSQFYLFDCDRQVDIAVPIQAGSVVTIGRDSILQCNDARISRNHGTLKLDLDESAGVQITSTHSNPIFIRTGVDGVLNILAKDLTATLQTGDKFALLPDQYWYEVRFGELAARSELPANGEVTSTGPALRVRTMEEVNSGPLPEAPVTGEKRKNGEDSEGDSSKRPRNEADDVEDGVVDSAAVPESPSFEATTPTVVKPDPDGNEAAEASSSSSAPPQQPDENPTVEVKKETADSTGPPLRPSCQFGIACYRHTADHRSEFAHPHDVDYRRPALPPAPDDAPHCPFGAACYRRNPVHFREYQHPDSTSVTPAPPAMNVVRVPVIHVPPPGRRRLDRFARDMMMAAIMNGVGADDGDDTESGDDDDGGSLFGSGSDSDEYIPEGAGEEDEEEDDDRVLYVGDAESDEQDEE
uniref:PBZ-type domain-containing protein n=1 Tax=Culex tarsalis TaxID=7177 RepID=A0A1Q3F7C5_CULTA